jgi:hypothetical protein
MEGFVSIGQCYLNLIVQDIAFRTFVHLESGIYDHFRVIWVKADDLVVNFVMEEFLVGIFILPERLGSYQVTMPLFKVLFESTIFAFV